MKKLFLIVLLTLPLSGCVTGLIALFNCIDSILPKMAKEKNRALIINLKNIKTDEKYIIPVICESYYDSQCSTRGNLWAWRDIKRSETYTVESTEGYPVTFSFTNGSCQMKFDPIYSEIFKDKPFISHMYVKNVIYNGKKYKKNRHDKNLNYYFYWDYDNNKYHFEINKKVINLNIPYEFNVQIVSNK